jgi:hypothetical protein
MKLKDLILVGLICVNVVLAALAVGFYVGKVESTAYATSESRGGDYIMVTGPITNSRDALLVIDVVAQRANLYIPKVASGPATAGRWDLADSHSLVSDFGVGK